MPKQVDSARKPQLLAAILEYLLDKPISALSFRTLAEHLDVSTFVLVYHFGSKESLLSAIVDEVCATQRRALYDAHVSTENLDDYVAGLRNYWNWTLVPRNRELQRLEFEAAMIESLGGTGAATTRRSLEGWQQLALTGLLAVGVPPEFAEVESRMMTNLMYGLQYDLTVRGDELGVTESFEYAVSGYRSRIEGYIAARAASAAQAARAARAASAAQAARADRDASGST